MQVQVLSGLPVQKLHRAYGGIHMKRLAIILALIGMLATASAVAADAYWERSVVSRPSTLKPSNLAWD
jgi:hypothetical protein